MDLRAYLTKHDGKPRPDGPELIRLKNAVGLRSAYYVYMVALGHKRVSEKTAHAMAANSIGGELDADAVNVKRDS
jgi:hypothetical protein